MICAIDTHLTNQYHSRYIETYLNVGLSADMLRVSQEKQADHYSYFNNTRGIIR